MTVGKSASTDSKTSKGTEKSAKSAKPKRSRALRIGGGIAGVIVLALGGGAAVVINDNRQIVVEAPPAVSHVAAPAAAAQSSLDDGTLRQKVTEIMEASAADPAFGQLHAVVSDASTGQQLWAKDDKALATPASSLKILTSAAALLGLGENHRVATSVSRVTGTNDVVLQGAGDPTLSVDGEGFFNDAASIADLAEKVSKAIPEGVGTVYVDTSLFTETFHDKWEREGLADGYIAPVESVMVDAGRIDPTDEDSQRSATPAADAGAALATALGAKNGGNLAEAEKDGAQLPLDPSPVATVDSAPLITRVHDMMNFSDNVLAESIARELAIARHLPPTFAGAAQAVRDTLTEHGFPLDGAVLSDSSGLSTDNRITPQHLAEVLNAAAGPEGSQEAGETSESKALRPLLDCLPVAGVSGTLTTRFDGTPGAGVVRAKTGTLNKASALAGYVVTESGQVLTFVLISNEASLLPARAAADKAASKLAEI
ncbi:MAG: D-alanyl-D-alanine carboxypeptidase/D-alanyl-D-alanine-endopeptidase [Corynebacterium sp.]|uniref:D-alanyl-D-alanine carboxypeptidase/D-alanyl-D-alanine endopeptidase n=1 Tax=Corynebacterium sp. TaxID=1720 RepID=UPI0026DD6FE9|nr:D-alanyl-D-alanine carboxypeptidase/D-alanyl-D-alanine-endopeptidase [Corynebacterium sp.]MDO5030578.1 D-alanyl-D-alanine carboxypeptidase/D-alanyl-D-alanine-endopeptidase [Corynebacterium sp.]